MHFLEFTHAEPKYTYVFPSRSQWAVAASNNSCSDDPYVPMTSNHTSTMDVMVTVISTRFCFVCTVVQSFIQRDAGDLQSLWFFVGRSLSLPVHGVTHFSVLVVMGLKVLWVSLTYLQR